MLQYCDMTCSICGTLVTHENFQLGVHGGFGTGVTHQCQIHWSSAKFSNAPYIAFPYLEVTVLPNMVCGRNMDRQKSLTLCKWHTPAKCDSVFSSCNITVTLKNYIQVTVDIYLFSVKLHWEMSFYCWNRGSAAMFTLSLTLEVDEYHQICVAIWGDMFSILKPTLGGKFMVLLGLLEPALSLF